MNKKLKLIIGLPALIIVLWVCMAIIDYTLSIKVMPPLFAHNINASDAAIYHGIGYTIIIDDGYAISPEWAEQKGYFYWGWR